MNRKVLLSYAYPDRHLVKPVIAQLPELEFADSLDSEILSGDDIRGIKPRPS